MDLTGDRLVENAFVIKHMPKHKRVIDIGCCGSVLYQIAMEQQNKVTAVDLNQCHAGEIKNINFIQGDFLKINFVDMYDYVILCSSLEHFGISGRYGSYEDETADYKAMQKVKQLTNQEGKVALTLPVGIFNIIRPWHRIYGAIHLGMLFEGFKIIEQVYYTKKDGVNFSETTQLEALNTKGSKDYYALGCYLLTPYKEKHK